MLGAAWNWSLTVISRRTELAELAEQGMEKGLIPSASYALEFTKFKDKARIARSSDDLDLAN